jgi:glutathione synthase/RimK-type ligase-like ATP-grasp enzyme
MILIITNKHDITCDYVINFLKKEKIDYFRLNTEDIGNHINITLHINKNELSIFDTKKNVIINSETIKSVYFRRPKLPDFSNCEINKSEYVFLSREIKTVLSYLYGVLKDKFWINYPDYIFAAENKLKQLTVAKKIGFNIPQTIVSNSPCDVDIFVRANKHTIIKPIKTGHIDGSPEKVIFTTDISTVSLTPESVNLCPVLLQEKIIKAVDVRVTVVGDKTFATSIFSQEHSESKTDWRKAELPSLKHESLLLPDQIHNKCIKMTKIYNLEFSAIDLAIDRFGEYIFFEINPNGQWVWIETRTNHQICSEIVTKLNKNN